jgi:proteasome lid subunit RPN8/RPN11
MTSAPAPTGPDVRQLRLEELPESAFPGGRRQAFRVFLEPAVHERVWKHAGEDTSLEICGVLVGKWARDADGPYALVSETVRGEAATSKFAEVTFTHETWAKINQEMDTKFSHLAIIGWYHSHPNFGVFLSDRDRFIQENFFSGPGQVAYVVDPVRKTEGVFIWRGGKPTLAPYYWVGDRVQVATPAGAETLPPELERPAPGAVAGPPRSPRPAAPPDWLGVLAQAGVYLLVFLVGYLLAGKISDLERQQLEQRADREALGRWFYANYHPGLRAQLLRIGDDLEKAAKNASALAEEHIKLVEKHKEAKSQWREEVFLPLARVAQRLGHVELTYCLTPDEEDQLRSLRPGKSRTDTPVKDAKHQKRPGKAQSTKDGKSKSEVKGRDKKRP